MIEDDNRAGRAVTRLIAVMAALRHPETGCAWDREQTHRSLIRYAIEEAYELADAVDRGDDGDLKSELGDFLFQVVFHARVAEERGAFDVADVADAIADKMIARHPHVFADQAFRDREEQERAWEAAKAAERAAKAAERTVKTDASALADVPRAAPALMRAAKLQKRAARVGFDWAKEDAQGPLDKVREETGEVRAALAAGDAAGVEEEIGDLLFAAVNVARRAGVDPETALARANAKFERRFRAMEHDAPLESGASRALADWEALWSKAKADER